MPSLSIVIPFFNEVTSVPALVQELKSAFPAMGDALEVLLVDDGSTDGTHAALEQEARLWPVVRVLRHDTNRGQAAALWDGFRAARGEWIGMLDGDGQNPPEELARLWTMRFSADMITGARVNRSDSWLRRTMSRVANRVRLVFLNDGVTDSGCSLKLFRAEVRECFLPIRSLYSFLPAFANAAGWKVIEMPVSHRPRRTGVSKYGLRTMAWRPMMDMLALTWLLRRGLILNNQADRCSPSQ